MNIVKACAKIVELNNEYCPASKKKKKKKHGHSRWLKIDYFLHYTLCYSEVRSIRKLLMCKENANSHNRFWLCYNGCADLQALSIFLTGNVD